MKKLRISALSLLAAFCICFLAGCGKEPVEKEDVLVVVGDTVITLADFNERLANLPERYREIADRRKADFIEELINDTLLYQEALRMGIDKDEEVKKVLHEARKKILIAKLLQNRIEEDLQISKEDVVEYYEENIEMYVTSEVMRASHILLNSLEEAEKILEQLSMGVSFVDLARARSLDPTAQRGGDIGYFPKGQLMPDFERACSSLEVGETSGIVRTSLGYHIIKLTDRKEPSVRPIEEVQEEITYRLREAKRRELFNDMLMELKKNTHIEVNDEMLGFDPIDKLSENT